MKTESTVRPSVVERYPGLLRINYDVSEQQRAGMDGEEPVTMYVYRMLEFDNPDIGLDELTKALINDKYPLEQQVDILSADDAAAIQELKSFRLHCHIIAMQVLGMPMTLSVAKEAKLSALDTYNESDAVNGFDVVIQGQATSLWIDKKTRSDYRSSIEAAELLGETEVRPVFGDKEVPLSVQMAKTDLAKIQLYANQCFVVTERHRAAISQLKTVEEVNEYDYTVGYPPRLIFEI